MKINHIAMYVNDLEREKDFFIRYFRSYFLTFDDGARLEIMNRPDVETAEAAVLRMGYIHMAFSVGSRERVDEVTETLRKDGFTVVSGPRVTGDGYYESCIFDAEGNLIEITV